ncbi:hypothetical protein VTL71DRAFT_7264 [Oculimacula yallundae]|uniref:BTB domain-containing protein n=1 Tax=Oculimacula yallundae TaxID=86028 RepID=A0ABR4BWA0_9HELO
MAVELLRGKESHESFMKRLFTSQTIEITCPDDMRIIKFPEVLARAASERFRVLCQQSERRSFKLEELCEAINRERLLCDQTMLNDFVEWLYTSKIPEKSCNLFFDLWSFGSMIGASRFETTALRALSTNTVKYTAKEDVNDRCELLFAHPNYIQGNIKIAWDNAHFSPARHLNMDCTVRETFWENNRRLLFLFDTAAWQGLRNTGVAEIIRAGGDQAVVLNSRMMLVAYGDINGPPWLAENIEKYLSEETPPDSNVSEKRKSAEEFTTSSKKPKA